MSDQSVSRQLADWALALRYRELPSAVIEDVKLRLLDTIGLMVAGAATPMGRAVRATALSFGRSRAARLIPSAERVTASAAALALGTQAHAEDFDDTHNESIMHSSAPVVATVLALGDSKRFSAQQALLLIAIGNEINCRLGSAAPGRFHDQGFHPTSVLGAVTSALLAARVLGLDATAATHAMGIAGSQASGILEAYEDGTWSKTMHPGWAAHAGIVAANLASHGFTGPATVIEGRFGVFATFARGKANQFDFTRIDCALGEHWEQLNSSFKPYPCAHAIHSFVEAALEARRALRLRGASTIASVQARVAPHFVPLICEPRTHKVQPRTPTHARASLQYALAAALRYGRLTPRQYQPEAIADVRTLSLAEKVSYQLDPRPPATTQYKGAVSLRTNDGRRKSVTVAHNPGSRENPMSVADLREKFERNCERWSARQRRRVAQRILTMERAQSLQEVIDLCS